MNYQKKQYSTEPKKPRTRRRDEHARINVVSLRLSNQEKRILDRITKSSSKNVSEVVREAIEFWLAKRKGLCLDS